jgi:ribosomal protein L18E
MEKELETDVFEAYQKQVPSPRARAGSASAEPALYFKQSQAYVKSIRNHLKNELGLTTDVPPIRSALEIWSVVSEALKEARTKEKVEFLLVKDERYLQERGDLIVIVGDLPDGDKISKCLKLHTDLVESAEPQAPKATKDGKQEITIKMKFKEKKQETAGKTETATAEKPQ